MSGLRVVVLGMMGRLPFGGQTWLYLSWLRGLAELGHDVWYVEDDSVWPYDPVQNTVTDDCSYASSHLARCMERIGLADRWAFRLAGYPDACYGVSESKLGELYGSSDVLLNVVGATDLREEQLRAPFRVYVQTDPVTAELRLANGDEHTREAFANHHVIATYGENYGAADCGVPLNGHRYVKTRQPVDLGFWTAAYDPGARHFTTIGNYRHEGEDVEWGGEVYTWSKHHQWERFIDLPRRTSQPFRLAMKPESTEDVRLLRDHAASSRWPRTRTCGSEAAGSASATPATWPVGSPWSRRTPVSARSSPRARGFLRSRRAMRLWPRSMQSTPTMRAIAGPPARSPRSTSTRTRWPDAYSRRSAPREEPHRQRR